MILFLDACIIIYWVESKEPFHSQVMKVLRNLKSKDPEATFAVSRLSLLECQVVPLREKNHPLEEAYKELFSMGELEIVELDASIIERATQIRASLNLRTPDAIQASSALSLGDKVLFITGDDKFKKVSGLQVLCL